MPGPAPATFPGNALGGGQWGRGGSRKQLLQFLSQKDHPRPSFPELKNVLSLCCHGDCSNTVFFFLFLSPLLSLKTSPQEFRELS